MPSASWRAVCGAIARPSWSAQAAGSIGSGAVAGVSSGLLYSLFGYSGVNFGNAVFGALLIVGTMWTFLVVRRQAPVAVTTG